MRLNLFILYRSFFLSMRFLPILTLRGDKMRALPLLNHSTFTVQKTIHWSRVSCSLWRIFFKKIILDVEDKVYVLGFDKRLHEWKIDLDEEIYRSYVFSSWESLFMCSYHVYKWKNKIGLVNYQAIWYFWAYWGSYLKRVITNLNRVVWQQMSNFNVSFLNATKRWHFFFLLFWYADVGGLKKELPVLEAKDVVYDWLSWMDIFIQNKIISIKNINSKFHTHLLLLVRRHQMHNYHVNPFQLRSCIFRTDLCNTLLFSYVFKQIHSIFETKLFQGITKNPLIDVQRATVLSKKVFGCLLDNRVDWCAITVLSELTEDNYVINNTVIDFSLFYLCLVI